MTGDYKKCWICQQWSRDDLTELVSLEGSEVPICLACVEVLRQRDNILNAKKGVQNAAAPGTGTVQDQLTTGGAGHAPNVEDPGGKGPESERMDTGSDTVDHFLEGKDLCKTEGCTNVAVFTQAWLVDGEGMPRLYRRCAEHQNRTEDLPKGRLLSVKALM